MSMEKTGDIGPNTPTQNVKAKPGPVTTKEAADDLEASVVSGLIDTVADSLAQPKLHP